MEDLGATKTKMWGRGNSVPQERCLKVGLCWFCLCNMNANIMSFMLSDVCELTGLWGPNLFSYRKGISPFTMVLVMRRSMYKIMHTWGQIWILDWDESGA